jgi:hypothetical protein
MRGYSYLSGFLLGIPVLPLTVTVAALTSASHDPGSVEDPSFFAHGRPHQEVGAMMALP